MNNQNEDKKMIVTRFAPSPTGFLHIGGARTALFNYLFTKKNGGEFILRIDDTDIERSKKEYEVEMLKNLEVLGMKSDRPIVRQSERVEIYRGFIQKLIEQDFAYVSKEEKGERDEVIRFRNPNKKIIFDDLIRGRVEFQTNDLGDFVIAKSLDEPIYHLASIIDDYQFGITHLIRAEEHLSNTPRQILLLEAIGAPRPIYAHIPLVLAKDRSKLSKREGAVSVNEFLDGGYEPEAIVNYLALLGWHPSDDQEIFSFAELINRFELDRVQKGGAIWDIEKLDWINKEHLKNNKAKVFAEIRDLLIGKYPEVKLISKNSLNKITELIFERIVKVKDTEQILNSGEFDFFFSLPNYEVEGFLWKDKTDFKQTSERLGQVLVFLSDFDQEWTAEKIKETIWPITEKEGRGEVLWPFRFSLSGLQKSPDPFIIAEILGKEKTIKRIEKSIDLLNSKN